MRVLITGANGSLGRLLAESLFSARCHITSTDLTTLDVRNAAQVESFCNLVQPDLIYHLAAAKHAPEGELDPWHVAETNVVGTRNILQTGVRTILASTCKACDPETVYGASKLIAERMTLEAGGSVARFYNVRESCGNVFETWRSLPDDEPLPVTDCFRYFVSLERAVDLLLWVAEQPPGRYTLKPDGGAWMREEAKRSFPGREQVRIPRRRGDRRVEHRHAYSERLRVMGPGFEQIICDHDPVREQVAA